MSKNCACTKCLSHNIAMEILRHIERNKFKIAMEELKTVI